MPIYMKFGGIDGGVTTQGYEKWIELGSFQYGVGRAVSSGSGGNTRESSAPNISEIVVTKQFDTASAKLYQDSVAGTFDTKVEIKMNTTTKNKTETFLTFELSDCGVSSYSLSSGGDNPMESLSLNFIKVMVTPTPLDKSGQIKKGDVVSYDLLSMKAS
ncbi:MAG: Hcp1 family type VI secretion system effector [Rhodospirillales bacterium]|nr:Hcp1 family type VI secretion system effector [Rhodospirillales bacterium]